MDRAGRVRVSLKLLKELLHLPEGHEIISVQESLAQAKCVEVVIVGPMMPEVKEDGWAPRVTLTYEQLSGEPYPRLVAVSETGG